VEKNLKESLFRRLIEQQYFGNINPLPSMLWLEVSKPDNLTEEFIRIFRIKYGHSIPEPLNGR
jgi:hypothetical protein